MDGHWVGCWVSHDGRLFLSALLSTVGIATGAVVLGLKAWVMASGSPAIGSLWSWSDEPELGDGVGTSTTGWAQHDGGGGVLQQADVERAVQDVATT